MDGSGNAFVTGSTSSRGFPTVGPFQLAYGGGASDAFAAKIDATGSNLVYCTYLGGSDQDQALGIAIDAAGNAYVTGDTRSANFHTAMPLQAAYSGDTDAFVAKLNPAGSALVYSTFLGRTGF